MARRDDDGVGPGLGFRDLLFRAALLAGSGSQAREWADRVAGVMVPEGGRSCLEAGSPLQVTVDAPGAAGLRVGLRVAEGDAIERAKTVIESGDGAVLTDAIEAVRRDDVESDVHLGTWLFLSPDPGLGHTAFLDLRDGSPRAALERVAPLVDPALTSELRHHETLLELARPWALRLQARNGQLCRVHVHWLVNRHRAPELFAERFGMERRWHAAAELLAPLLRVHPKRVGRIGRWVFALPVDGHSEVGLRAATSAWSILADDARKQSELGRVVDSLGGKRDHVEALYHLCRTWGGDRRVGRSLEVRVVAGPRLRVGLVPGAIRRGRAPAPE